MAKQTKPSASPPGPESAIEQWDIDGAFCRILQRVGNPKRARSLLHEGFRTEELQLWLRRKGDPWIAMPNQGAFYELNLVIEAREQPDGWHANMAMRGAIDAFSEYEWAVRSDEVETLLHRKSLPPAPMKSGAPGRPTSMHYVLAEAKRRLDNKIVMARPRELGAFAGSLATWWEQERLKYNPPPPELGAGRIENAVRSIWNAALCNPTKMPTKL